MKKIICLIMALMMIALSAVALSGCDDKKGSSSGGLLYKKYSGDEFFTVYGFELDKDENDKFFDVDNGVIDIQKIVGEDKTVGAIGVNAFKGISNVKKIIVPNTVTEIEAGAFAEMKDLEELVVPFIGKNIEADSTIGETAGSNTKSVNFARTMYYWFATTTNDDACEISNEEFSGGATIKIKCNAQASEIDFYMPVNFTTLTVNANKIDNEDTYVIPAYACYGSFLETVNLKNVKNIGDNSFGNCRFLRKTNDHVSSAYQEKVGQDLIETLFG